MPSRNGLESELRALVARILEVEESKLCLDVRFVEDLDMDSMRALEILAAIEKKYHIEVPDEKLVKMTCLGDLLNLTEELLPPKSQ